MSPPLPFGAWLTSPGGSGEDCVSGSGASGELGSGDEARPMNDEATPMNDSSPAGTVEYPDQSGTGSGVEDRGQAPRRMSRKRSSLFAFLRKEPFSPYNDFDITDVNIILFWFAGQVTSRVSRAEQPSHPSRASCDVLRFDACLVLCCAGLLIIIMLYFTSLAGH